MPRTLWIALSPDPAQIAEACTLLSPTDEHHVVASNIAGLDEEAWRAAGARTIVRRRRMQWTDWRLRRHVRRLGIERFVVISHGMSVAIEPLLSWWALGRPAEFLRFAPAWRADEQRYEARPQFWYTRREPLLNIYGFRGAAHRAAAQPESARVACIGGSTTYGSGYLARNLEMRAEDSYPAQLEAAGGWRVLNLGITGLGASCQVARLRRYVAWRPDVVLVHVGYNDLPIVVGCDGDRYAYITPDLDRQACLDWLVDYYTRGGRTRVRRLRDELARRSPVRGDTYLGHDLTAAGVPHEGSAGDVAREADRRNGPFLRAVDRLVAVALSLGARVLVIGQPAIRPGLWVWRSSLRSPESASLLADLHRRQQLLLRRRLETHYGNLPGFRFADMFHAFDRDPAGAHIDEVHLGLAGNRMLAELLAPHVARLLAAPAPLEAERAELRGETMPGRRWTAATAPVFAALVPIVETGINVVRRVRRRPEAVPPRRRDDSPFLYPMR